MNQQAGLLLSEDLLFVSKITGTATACGLKIAVVRAAADLVAQVEQVHPACVLLDLHHPGLDIAALVKALHDQPSRPVIVGYGSHVDVATLKQARDAGCDLVLPRSKFVEELPTALSRWFAGSA